MEKTIFDEYKLGDIIYDMDDKIYYVVDDYGSDFKDKPPSFVECVELERYLSGIRMPDLILYYIPGYMTKTGMRIIHNDNGVKNGE